MFWDGDPEIQSAALPPLGSSPQVLYVSATGHLQEQFLSPKHLQNQFLTIYARANTVPLREEL